MKDLSEARRIVEQQRGELERLRRAARVYNAVSRACAELPEGWNIRIDLERGAGTVSLVNPDGDDVEFPSDHDYLSACINDAINAAIEQGQAYVPANT